MRKVIAAINMTLDGFCDHTAIDADEEIHQHYTELINDGGAMLYGRITYQLMESYWPALIKTPTGNKAMDEFAVAIDTISKIVFSRTMKDVASKTARLAKRDIKDEISELKQQQGKDILVGSPSLIVSLLNLNLIDEFQLCVHPVILGNGSKLLLKIINERIDLKLFKTKTFKGGAIVLYYEPEKK